MDTIIAIIWVVFMIIAAISAIAKKAKQQQDMQARESTGEEAEAKSKRVYTAPEEDIRTFLEQIGAKPPMPVESRARVQEQPVRTPVPERPQVVRQTQLPQPQRKKPRRPKPPKPAAKKAFQWDDTKVGPDTREAPESAAVDDAVAALTSRLSPIQRAVVWREILDPPPGLRAGAFVREA